MKLRFDSHAVISYVDNGFSSTFSFADLYQWIWLVTHIFGGVIDQVFQHFSQAGVICINDGEVW